MTTSARWRMTSSSSSFPIPIWSPAFRMTSPCNGLPFTRVPLVLPRSRRRIAYSSILKTQWWRLTRSLLGRKWQSCSRPTRNFFVDRGIAFPWCLPPRILSSACNMIQALPLDETTFRRHRPVPFQITLHHLRSGFRDVNPVTQRMNDPALDRQISYSIPM